MRHISKQSQLTEFQTEHPLAHELPYWEFLDDGTVVLKDATLVSGLKIQPLSIETKTEEELNDLTVRIRAFLSSLPDGMELQFQIESHSDESEKIDAHSNIIGKIAAISEIKAERVAALREQMKHGAIRRLDITLFIYERPSGVSGAASGFFSSKKEFEHYSQEEHESRVRSLQQKVSLVSSLLESTGVEVSTLGQKEVRRLVYEFLNPSRRKSEPTPQVNKAYKEQEFSASDIAVIPELSFPSPREQLCFSDLKLSENSFRLDGLHHSVISLKTLPEWTYSSLISKLLTLPMDYTFSLLVKVPDQSKEIGAIQAKRRVAFSMLSGSAGKVSDLESEAKLESTEELLRELINTGQKIFFFQVAVLIRAKTENSRQEQEKIILSELRKLNGAEGLVETYANFKLFKSILPGGSLIQVRAKRVKTDNLADFAPIYGPYPGNEEPVCLFQNREGALVKFDPFDRKLPNFNMLVTGSSGSGKSFLNNCIELQHLSRDPSVFIIDIGGSYRKLCSVLGGEYVELSSGEMGKVLPKINPFQLPVGETSPSPGKLKFLVSLLETIFSDEESEKLSKLSKSLLEETVTTLYADTFPKIPTLSSLMEKMKGSQELILRDYAKMLFPWTGARAFGLLLDGEGTLTLSSDFVVFDLKGLSHTPDLQSVMVLIITDFILGRIDGTPRKKRILLDECWSLLKSKGAANFMEYCARTLRKTGSGITFITQGLEEINQSDIGAAILNNTATKLILLQKGDLDVVRKTLKLNDHEVSLISSLRQSKGDFSEAFLMTGDDRTVIRVSPTPLEYWVSTSDAEDLNEISKEQVKDPLIPVFDILKTLAKFYPKGMSERK